ncbi:MAG: hypothetical protein ACD_37C00429G0002 [uncultured bacterium]|nr:MAG: hypothetical protein ACD_37C00429G0002 [uncultured bacterium]
MESIKRNWKSFKRSAREFHTKKPQLEFFTALLTIPVLLTVIILNLNNLKANDKKEAPKSETIVITQQAAKEKEVIVTKEACKAGIGQISISDPSENDKLEDNPVTIDISYEQGDYCAVVWSYRINNGRYSDYDDRSIALYNLPNGNIKFDLRVKSVVNNDQKTLTRNFIYSGSSTPTPTPFLTMSPTPSE